MKNSYCGKDCSDCLSREEIGCPGCKMGPGKSGNLLCDIANCCNRKCKDDCEECEACASCSLLSEQENMMQKWNESRTVKKTEAAGYVGSGSGVNTARDKYDAPLVRQSLLVIFWMFLLGGFGNVLSNENLFGSLSVVMGLGSLIGFAAKVVAAVCMLRLAKEEEKYKVAGICYLVGAGIMVVAELLVSLFSGVLLGSNILAAGVGMIFALLLLVGAVVVDVISGYKFLVANAAIVERRDLALSERWRVMSKVFFAVIGGIIVVPILLVALRLFGAIVGLLYVLGVLAFGVCEYVFLYQTANRFRE